MDPVQQALQSKSSKNMLSFCLCTVHPQFKSSMLLAHIVSLISHFIPQRLISTLKATRWQFELYWRYANNKITSKFIFQNFPLVKYINISKKRKLSFLIFTESESIDFNLLYPNLKDATPETLLAVTKRAISTDQFLPHWFLQRYMVSFLYLFITCALRFHPYFRG